MFAGSYGKPGANVKSNGLAAKNAKGISAKLNSAISLLLDRDGSLLVDHLHIHQLRGCFNSQGGVN